MDIIHETSIVRKTYDLYKLFYGYLVLFPKKDRHALGNKSELCMLSILELLIAASSGIKTEKAIALRQASIKLDIIKVLLRLAKDIDIIGLKQYIALQERIQQIGKELGGWQRSLF